MRMECESCPCVGVAMIASSSMDRSDVNPIRRRFISFLKKKSVTSSRAAHRAPAGRTDHHLQQAATPVERAEAPTWLPRRHPLFRCVRKPSTSLIEHPTSIRAVHRADLLIHPHCALYNKYQAPSFNWLAQEH